jgi:hypothetical protein
MAPGIDPIQFPSQIWQAVSDQARRSLLRLEFCPDQSRIENLRSVHLCEETEENYGKQVWFFEAVGIDAKGARHLLYGALELSVQYGVLVTDQTALFDDIEERQRFLRKESNESVTGPWAYDSTRFWVNTAITCVVVVSLIWVSTLFSYLTR